MTSAELKAAARDAMECKADESAPGKKVTLCHFPPGNPENAHTITIGESAVPKHIALHGDHLGACVPGEGNGGGGDAGTGEAPDAGSGGGDDAGTGEAPDAGSGGGDDAGTGGAPDAGSGGGDDAGTGGAPDAGSGGGGGADAGQDGGSCTMPLAPCGPLSPDCCGGLMCINGLCKVPLD